MPSIVEQFKKYMSEAKETTNWCVLGFTYTGEIKLAAMIFEVTREDVEEAIGVFFALTPLIVKISIESIGRSIININQSNIDITKSWVMFEDAKNKLKINNF